MFFQSTSKPWIAYAIIFSLILGMLPLFLNSPRSGPSFGSKIDPSKVVKTFPEAPTESELAGTKEVVKIGVYILSVGNLDTTTSRYSVDFFLNYSCVTEGCDPSDFDLMNAGAGPEIVDQTDPTEPGYYYYRIRSTMRTNLDLRDFPFDEHVLEIEIEDKNKNTNDLVYIADPSQSGIDSSVYVSGWDLEPSITGEVNAHNYDIYNESYSRALFYIRITHPWFSSFMKGLFAAIVIVGVGMLSFLMKPSEAKDRIGLTSGTLASAIFYHMTLTSSIPPVGYLTYADRFMILQYIFITASLGVSISLFLFQFDEHNQERMMNLHHATRWTIPVLWVVSMVLLHVATIGF